MPSIGEKWLSLEVTGEGFLIIIMDKNFADSTIAGYCGIFAGTESKSSRLKP